MTSGRTHGRVGVAISTTGDEHRMKLLQRCVAAWDQALTGLGQGLMFVTVDGTEADAERVRQVVFDWTGAVFRVGRPVYPGDMDSHHRLGVAANKNTGLESLMDNTNAEHLFLSDDDTWPLHTASLDKHIRMGVPHSMVCWGAHRLIGTSGSYATWTWPRGVMLYTHRSVVETVGGMDERFGPGGHEHVEYSQRIHNADLTPAPFISPSSYALRGPEGPAMRASALWHCEDMRRPGEKLGDHRVRQRGLTSIRRSTADWAHIEKVMAEREGSAEFVDYRAATNGRASATLCQYTPSQGAGQA